jgi:hypothetical protein
MCTKKAPPFKIITSTTNAFHTAIIITSLQFLHSPCKMAYLQTNFHLTLLWLRLQVLTAESMKLRAFWNIAPSSLGVDGHFRGVYCLHHEADEYAMNKGFAGYIGISQTSVTWADEWGRGWWWSEGMDHSERKRGNMYMERDRKNVAPF